MTVVELRKALDKFSNDPDVEYNYEKPYKMRRWELVEALHRYKFQGGGTARMQLKALKPKQAQQILRHLDRAAKKAATAMAAGVALYVATSELQLHPGKSTMVRALISRGGNPQGGTDFILNQSEPHHLVESDEACMYRTDDTGHANVPMRLKEDVEHADPLLLAVALPLNQKASLLLVQHRHAPPLERAVLKEPLQDVFDAPHREYRSVYTTSPLSWSSSNILERP
jgi:hypothetical protein